MCMFYSKLRNKCIYYSLIHAKCAGCKRSLFFPPKERTALTISQSTFRRATQYHLATHALSFFLLILFTTVVSDGGGSGRRNSFCCPYPSTTVHRFSTVKKNPYENPLPTWYTPHR